MRFLFASGNVIWENVAHGRYTNYEQGFSRWQGVAGVGIRF